MQVTALAANFSISLAACCLTLPLSISSVFAADAPALATNGHPFAALPVNGGILVSVSGNGRPNSATGLRVFAGPSSTQLVMKCLQSIDGTQAMGLASTPNGKGVAVAAGDEGLILLGSAEMMNGCRGRAIAVPMGKPGTRQGSLDVAVTPDGRFAFVANEYGVAAQDSTGRDIAGHVAVVALTYDDQGVPNGGRLVGRIVTGGSAVAGVALAPDGNRLYVTSEIAKSGARAANGHDRTLAHSNCHQGEGPEQPFGLLSVIDVKKVENGAMDAVVAATAAGCAPVRAVVSPDGRTVWVAARGDDKVFAFSANALEADPAHALLGAGNSGGKAPVGLALFDGGRRLAVANSNRFGGANATGNLAILDANPTAPKTIETVQATHFPRSVTTASDGTTLFLTDYNGGKVQVISEVSHPPMPAIAGYR